MATGNSIGFKNRFHYRDPTSVCVEIAPAAASAGGAEEVATSRKETEPNPIEPLVGKRGERGAEVGFPFVRRG